MAIYQVTDAVLDEAGVRLGDTKKDKYLLQLKGEDGATREGVIYWATPDRPEYVYAAGDTVEGEIVSAPRGGVKLSGSRKVEATQQADGTVEVRDYTSNGSNRERSIERQVALKAASEQATALIGGGTAVTAEEVVQRAEKYADWLEGNAEASQANGTSDDDIPF